MSPQLKQLEFKLDAARSESLPALVPVSEIYQRLPDILDTIGEDRRVEKKSGRVEPRRLGECFCAWGNTPEGGILLVGIEDHGEISGCRSCSPEQINKIEDSACIYCPEVRFESKRVGIRKLTGEEDFIIAFRVLYRTEKVVRTSDGKVFVRSGDNNRSIDDDQIRELQIARGEVHFDLETIALNYPEDFDTQAIAEFVETVGSQKGLKLPHESTEILCQQRLGAIVGKKFVPNNACCLLFAKDPVRQFPGCKIRFLRFEGEEERTGQDYNVVKDVIIEGTVPKQIQSAEQLISGQLREYSALGKDGKFYSSPEYPPDAWYEAIVNACAHRSYALRSMVIFVKMFDDRLQIISPGIFPAAVTPENIFEIHHPRNPFLMDALRYFGFVKCANEGTRRMREAMIRSELPPPVFKENRETSGNVVVTLRNNYKQRRKFIDTDAAKNAVSEAIFQTLTDEDKRIINFVSEYRSINVTQTMRVLNCEWGTAKKRLVGLCDRALLRHEHRTDLVRDPKARYVLNTSQT